MNIEILKLAVQLWSANKIKDKHYSPETVKKQVLELYNQLLTIK